MASAALALVWSLILYALIAVPNLSNRWGFILLGLGLSVTALLLLYRVDRGR